MDETLNHMMAQSIKMSEFDVREIGGNLFTVCYADIYVSACCH